MINLYTWSTPNGRKVSIALEELGLAYDVHPIDITKDDQFAPDFLKISPNNKIPAIVDDDTGLALFESGAILLYLGRKTGRLFPNDETVKWQVMQWLMWQMGGQGPMLGQAHHFLKFNAGKAPYAEERYHKEAKRLYAVLDKQLSQSNHVASEDLSVADIAIWPWASRFEWQQIDMNAFPNVKRWYLQLAERPSFQAGYKVPNPSLEIPLPA